MTQTKNKIITLVVLITLLATLTVGGFSSLYVKDRIHSFTLDYLSESTKVYGEEMNTIITQVETVTHTLSNSVKGIIDPNRINDSYYYYGLSDDLERIAESFDHNEFNIMSIYVRFNPFISYSTAGFFHADTDGDGELERQKPTNLLKYDPDDDEHVGWFYKPLESNQAVWLDPYYNANIGINMLSYVAPLEINGQVIGVVGVDINFDAFEQIVKEGPKIGQAMLINDVQRILVDDGLTTADILNQSPLVTNKQSSGTFEYSINKEARISGYSTLQNGWQILVSLTEDEALENLNDTINFLLLLNITIILIMTFIAILVGRQLNKMILRNTELEDKVKARTTELTATNHELNESLRKLKETQQQLIVSEKLAFLGELVSGIAHEINTPLGMGITLNSFIHQKILTFKKDLEGSPPSSQELNSCVDTMESSSSSALTNLKKVAEIMDTFKQVAVDQSGQEEETVLLQEHIRRILLSLSSRFDETNHKVKVNCPGTLSIRTYPGVLSQVFINLILNSLEHGFMDMDKGQIEISAVPSSTDQTIIIEYKDNGHALTDEDYDKVFDPFFTTARSTGSVGLGLHIIHSLVTHSLKGDVHIEKEAIGLHFVIILPMHLGNESLEHSNKK